MAKQISFITFTGKLGNLIGYERGGKYFLRSTPEQVRQTPATRRAAQRFGLASSKAALIRHAFYDELDIHCDSGHINRLNKLLIKAAGNHAAITRFRFNQYTGTDRFFSIEPKLFRNGTLHIPAQSIHLHKDIAALEIKVIATRIDFNSKQICHTETVVMTIDPAVHFCGADVPLDITGTGTLVVTLQIRGLDKEGYSRKQYEAADIIAVMEPHIPVFFSKPAYPSGILSFDKTRQTCISKPVVQRE
ncbi:hypothetical protein SAMN05428949_4821 [Chitinophaga sp. YR627]|uniref:hypothetical protein n=1 Tax=Chitinophaga sp. YR627 TaxID=1881041 RepID=UPI0008E74F27|nr:hypothetical protein [Chitinophaga sp. YR627]SFO29388.1 hypothetical protein SAMN05428949_4821 [Chitinophaga sp. YR627]